jgi:hypothetical protein
MTDLIGRVAALVNNDPLLPAETIQNMLDSHARELVQVPLTPTPPFYRKHTSPYGNLETGAIVYVGYNQQLTVDTDYTIDLLRGIVTTPAAEYRRLFLQGTAYDVYGAAADLWMVIAARSVEKVDVQSGKTSLSRSQEYEHALNMSKRYRALAWGVTTKALRSDTTGRGTTPEQVLQDFKRNHQ